MNGVRAGERIIPKTRKVAVQKVSADDFLASQTFINEIIEQSPIATWISDATGTMVRMNRACSSILNITDEEVVGKYNVLGDEIVLAQGFMPMVRNVFETGESANFTIQYDTSHLKKLALRKKASVILEVTIFPIKNDAGKIVGAVFQQIDITKHKEAEEALRINEIRYRELFDNMSSGVAVYQAVGDGADFVFVDINAAGEKWSQIKKEEVIGKSIQEVFPAVGHLGLLKVLGDVWRTGRPQRLKASLYKDERISQWVENYVFRLPSREVVAIYDDITAYKQTEDALRQGEQRYRELFEFLPIAVFEMSKGGDIIVGNHAAYELFGYSPEDVERGLNIAHLLIPSDLRRALSNIPKVMKGLKLGDNDYTIVRKNGERVPSLIYSNAVKQDDEVVGIRGTVIDISERRKNLDRLHKALLAIVSAVATTVERRDPYTAGHQRRVADLAHSIATELNLTPEKIEGIRIAASIHDIGKISVPSEILSRPSKLAPMEFELIKTHAEAGYDILKGIEFPWPIARMVLEHHERIDGSGYPHGLKGDDILLESKVIAVADVVEAIASHRPYRAALGIETALEEITKNKGTLYNPAVVDACLKLFGEKGYTLM
ncbi:MAG: PAS domain S-box protein [Smithellaceae bacterium]|nr:PAS domain S-box protein [Smithellaceae bacterium]